MTNRFVMQEIAMALIRALTTIVQLGTKRLRLSLRSLPMAQAIKLTSFSYVTFSSAPKSQRNCIAAFQ